MAEERKPADRVMPTLDTERLDRAMELLRARTLAGRARRTSVPRASAGSSRSAPTELDDLRFSMALRGWCNPAAIIPSTLAPAQRLALLDAIANESEMATIGPRPQWYLSDGARRRALWSHSPTAVADALDRLTREGDHCTTALRALYQGPLDPLPSYSVEELRALAAAAELTAGHAPNTVDINEARRWAARKSREQGYRKLLRAGFFGRSQEFNQLVGFLNAPFRGGSRAVSTWVWGPGGVGKSTLLAAACLSALEANESAALVHFDFDRSDLDPTRKSSLDLELLRQLGSVDADVDRRLEFDRERIREQLGDDLSAEYASSKARQSVTFEAADAASRSVIEGALEWLAERKAPLLLILDTWEQVQAGGPHYVYNLESWLSDLAFSSGLPEMRIVVCGRTEPSSLSLPTHDPPLKLPLAELKRDARVELLVAREMPRVLAEEIASTFGGNPLLLHLIANLLKDVGRQAVLEAAEKVRDGRYPYLLIDGLLYRRILKHLDEGMAGYAHPGLVLPELTVDLIRFVLGSVNDEPGMTEERAREIFDALGRALWLVEPSADGQALRQKPDDRRLTLQLIRSDPAKAAKVRAVHEAAAAYHRAGTSGYHQSRALYHELMLVRERSDLDAFEKRDLSESIRELRPYVEELPEIAQSYLQDRLIRQLGPRQARESLPDRAWQRYLVGEGDERGYGDVLVSRSDPLAALSLWRERPVGEPGRPPTFVIQALAETGEWDDGSLDIEEAVEDLKWMNPVERLRRLTAVTRLALLRRPAPLSNAHASFIHQVLSDSPREAARVVELCAIATVAEALGNEAIVPYELLDDSAAVASETRLYLVHTWRFGQRFKWRPQLDALVTIQRDWADRVGHLGDWLEYGDVREAQGMIDGLHGGPLDAVTRVLERLRRPVRIHTKPDRGDQVAHILLLRGPTPEFYRPVRQALREAFTSGEGIEELMTRLSAGLSIRPKDLEPRIFAARAQRDPVSMFLALATYVDRARVMAVLLDSACAISDAAKLHRVRDTWHFWDRSIGSGMSSSWGTTSNARDENGSPGAPPAAAV
jgi:hypothetical protein